MMHMQDKTVNVTVASSRAGNTRSASRLVRQTFLLAVVVMLNCIFNLMMKLSPTRRAQEAIAPETEESTMYSADDEKKYTLNRRIPSVLLAGTQKAGTSSLATYLGQLSNTCFSDSTNDKGVGGSFGKEPHFFDLHYEDGLIGYQNLFKYCSDTDLLIDGTPETMLSPERVREIYDEQGTTESVKIIFILREPVAREVSWYHHRLRYALLPDRPSWVDDLVTQNGTIKSFIQVCQENIMYTMERERYHKVYAHYAYWLKRWSSVFDRSRQILVLSYDEMSRDPDRFLRRVHTFLDLPLPAMASTSSLSLPRENTASDGSVKPKQPPCPGQLALAALFEQPNAELYDLLVQSPGPSMEQRPFPRFQLRCNATKPMAVA